MDRQFRNRLFIFAALCVLLPTVIVLCKLWVMQVTDHEEHTKRAESNRARAELLSPPRARVLDANGIVLADNESIWNLTLDVYELTHPRHVLARALASPEAYPPIAEIEAFHFEHVVPALEADPGPPVRARRFLNLWQLRQHPIALHDRQVVTEQVARLVGADPSAIDRRIDAVESEINAHIAAIGNPAKATQRQVQRAFNEAMAASRDPEYWERIRRFPKSLALDPLLRRRINGQRELLAKIQATANALEKAPDPNALLSTELRAAAEALSGFEMQLSSQHATAISGRNTPQSSGKTSPDSAESSAEHAELAEDAAIARRWLDVLGMAAGAEDAVRSMLDEAAKLDGVSGEIADLETRLGQLQEKLLKPWMGAWETRWPALLTELAGIAASEAVAVSGGYVGDSEGPGFVNPLQIAERVDREVVEALKTHRWLVGGVRCEARSIRRYPMATVAQGLVGHVRLPDSEALEERMIAVANLPEMQPLSEAWFDGNQALFASAFRGTLAQQPTGVTGIEGFYESRLAGTPGARAMYVDARGTEQSVEGEWQPIASGDLRLTLDAELMEFAAETVRSWEPKLRHRALSKGGNQRKMWDEVGDDAWALRGSLIIMDVETGAVVVMLDINDQLTGRETRVAGTPAEYPIADAPPSWRWMDPASSLPRSVGGLYEPGSTFKILTSIAMLESGTINANSRFDDVHKQYRIGSQMSKTSHPVGPNVDIVRAISESSNGFYYHYSTKMGGGKAGVALEDVLNPWARQFGFGERPGIDITGLQVAGRLPRRGPVDDPPEFARNVMGQGALISSPLQVARFMTTVANRGTHFTPHLSAESDGAPVKISVSDETWRLVHQGMYDCVHHGRGTASKSSVMRRIGAAGKTGTAQTGHFWSRAAWQERTETGKRIAPDLQKPDHAWFAGFAPAKKPKYAFVMLAEFSFLAGSDVADCVGEVVEAALAKHEAKSAAKQSNNGRRSDAMTTPTVRAR